MCIRDSYNTVSMLSYCSLQDAISAASADDVIEVQPGNYYDCLLYTSDAADERSSVDLGGRRIIKKKNK